MTLTGKPYIWAAHLVCLLAVCSCSIKEDRMDCPCILTVDFSQYGGKPFIQVSQKSYSPQKKLIVGPDRISEAIAEFKVRRAPAHVCTYTDPMNADVSESSITVRPGHEWIELFADAAVADCTLEEALVVAKPHKQFARLSISISGWEEPFPYRLRIESNTCGMGLTSLEPLEGPYRFETDGAPEIVTVIPRQCDESLSLTVLDKDKPIRTIPIGKAIADEGYDWSEEDLDDIIINLDLFRTTALITVLPWEEESGDTEI